MRKTMYLALLVAAVLSAAVGCAIASKPIPDGYVRLTTGEVVAVSALFVEIDTTPECLRYRELQSRQPDSSLPSSTATEERWPLANGVWTQVPHWNPCYALSDLGQKVTTSNRIPYEQWPLRYRFLFRLIEILTPY